MIKPDLGKQLSNMRVRRGDKNISRPLTPFAKKAQKEQDLSERTSKSSNLSIENM